MRRSGSRIKTGVGYTIPNKIKLVTGGRSYFDQLLQLIDQARQTIQLQVYIFDSDQTGREVADALIAAAKRNVSVYLLVDGYASQKLPKIFIQELITEGIHFRFFEPLFRSRHSYFGRRLHHKVIVVDNRYAMAGGINISNHYNDLPTQPGWLDFALLMEGAIVNQLCALCEKVWEGFVPDKEVSLCKPNLLPFEFTAEENSPLRMRRNDWIMKRNQISKSYIEMFRNASDHIIMMSGYFLPGRVIRKNMKKAVARGVKIKLVLAGISDVMVAKNAERYMYSWLFRNQIEVYEYKPCVLHGKVATYDRKWATIGSYNVNDISAYASIELNIDVNDPGFAAKLDDRLSTIIENDCVLITKESFRMQNYILNRIWEQLCYWFIRVLFYIFTFNFKQRDN